ncbi:MAG: twin-arginine translocation pathway signal protein, partial [Sphingomonadales bacterium]
MRALITLLAATAIALPALSAPAKMATPDRAGFAGTIAARHDATVKALQDWIAMPTIAAMGMNVK